MTQVTNPQNIGTSDFVTWPNRWRTVPLWSLFERIKDVGHPEEEMLSVYRSHGVVAKSSRDDNFNKTAENRNIYQLVDNGWLVVNRMKAWQGSVGISPRRGIVSGHYICFRPRHGENHRFLNWLMRSDVYATEYARLSRGVRPNQIEIDNDFLRVLPVHFPDPDEQCRIADFLDAETARIERLSSMQELIMKKLDERESAQLDLAIDELIVKAGTVQLRRFVWSADQGSSPQCDAISATEGEWGVLKVSCLRPGSFFPEENKRLPEGVTPEINSEIHEGDLLITRANTPQLVGSTAVVPKVRGKLLLSDKIFRVRLAEGMSPEFVTTVARGSRIRALCAAGSNGASQSMANIRFEEIKSWPLPAVGLDEQAKFVERISRGRRKLDVLRPAIQRQLALLAERRQALITAAVTGQIDVSTASGRGVDVS